MSARRSAAVSTVSRPTRLGAPFNAVGAPLRAAAACFFAVSRGALMRLLAVLAAAPVLGAIVRRYVEHYGSVRAQETRPSEHMRGLLERWSIKFSAEYYEERDRQEAARRERLAGSPPAQAHG